MHWETIKEDVYILIHALFNNNIPLQAYNEITITLIPKAKNPCFPFDWGPISLCNTTYKILAKIICNIFKQILSDILNQTQDTFTQCREVYDNAYVVLEIFHSILTKDKRLAKGKPCFAIKLDMTKAYD